MSDRHGLFEKADALLGRYRGETRTDPDYPVLTEVVEPVTPHEPAPPEQHSPALPPQDDHSFAEVGGLTEQQLAELESRMFEQLEPSIGALVDAAFAEAFQERLEERLRQSLHELMSQVKTEVETQLREQLADAIRSGVASLREPREPQ